jgi:hypothetical protein
VRRYLRWLILQTKADKIDTRKAGVMGQLGLYLLKSMEVADLETRLSKIERNLEIERINNGIPNNSFPTADPVGTKNLHPHTQGHESLKGTSDLDGRARGPGT